MRGCVPLMSLVLLVTSMRLGAEPQADLMVIQDAPADLVVTHASVETVVPGAARAQAIAVRGDRIIGVGSDAAMRALVGPGTEVLDARGMMVIPGFIEGHGHFMALGEVLGMIDLRSETSWQAIVQRLAAASRAAQPGAWIRGHGFHQDKWAAPPAAAVEGLPVHASLSAVSSENPVVLEHSSGHGLFVNAAALAAAGIDAATPDPAGGRIVRDAQGNPTGWLVDTAMTPVLEAIERDRASEPAAARHAERVEVVRRAGAEALAKGVTSFQDAGVSFATVDLYRELAARGAMPLRMYAMVGGDTVGGESLESLDRNLARYRTVGFGNNFLTVRAIKRMADGALGSRSARLLSLYTDDPSTSGIDVDPPAVVRRSAELALANGYQLNTHAIGDRANREVLDVYAGLLQGRDDARGLRWRIEHAQHLDPADVPRFATLGVIASMQGVHAASDGSWVAKRLGEPRAGNITYVWRSLWDSGAIVTNGTDVPVEDIDPLASFRASVTRQLADGSRFHPEQCLTRMEALVSYTRNNAYAAFEEDIKGTLEPGKLADFVLLSEDILQVPEPQLSRARVVATVLGGRIVYRDGSI